MTPVDEVLKQATALVEPSATEARRMTDLAKSLLAKTEKAASRFPETRGALLGGSFAKGTWLPKHVDIDIFLRLDPETPDKRFEQVGLSVGAKASEGYPRGKKFAQHPYTEAWADGIRINIVPCYKVPPKEWKSAADRSPYHVDLVKGASEETRRQIRLLKMFMIGVGVYGAEIEVQGFSGYIAEVLVLRRGSFLEVLRWFASFKRSGEEKMFSLPDPVDAGRDLATAVSRERLGAMILASREFLRRPALAFFREMKGKARHALRPRVVAVVFSHRRLSEDTLWGELRKATRHMVRHAEVSGFRIARSMAASNNVDESAILMIPEFSVLPDLEQRVGPTVDRRKDVEAFLKSNRSGTELAWVDQDARLRVLRPREETTLVGLLTAAAKGRAGPIGAPRELKAGLKRSARVLTGPALDRRTSNTGWLKNGVDAITSDAVGTG